MLPVDEVPVFTDPSEAAALCPASFHYGCTVYKSSSADIAGLLPQLAEEFIEFAADDQVVVFAVGILGNFGNACGLWGWGKIVEKQGNNRCGARHQPRRVHAQLEMIFHVVHIPVVSFVQPGCQPPGIVFQSYGLCYATVSETECRRRRLDESGIFKFVQFFVGNLI